MKQSDPMGAVGLLPGEDGVFTEGYQPSVCAEELKVEPVLGDKQ